MRIIYVATILILSALICNAQKWRSYNKNSGLQNDTVYSITIDKQKNVWIGSNSVVSVFDGNNWTNHFINDTFRFTNYIEKEIANYLTSDSLGNIWIGTDYGKVIKYHGSKKTSYYNAGSFNSINSIAADVDSNLWFATSNGVVKFNGSIWTNFDTIKSVYSVAIDKNGNKWFGSNQYGLSMYNDTNWIIYDTVQTNVYSIVIDANNNKWIGTSGGVFKFNGKDWINYQQPGFAYPKIIDKQGNIWFSTWDSGVWKYNGINWTNFTTKDSLIDNRVISIAVDAQNNKWIGTYGGISIYNEKGVKINFDNNNDTSKSSKIIKTTLNNILVYPTIATNLLTVELGNQLEQDNKITIFDINGKQLLSKKLSFPMTHIDIKSLINGVYIYRINNCNRGKIIKQ